MRLVSFISKWVIREALYFTINKDGKFSSGKFILQLSKDDLKFVLGISSNKSYQGSQQLGGDFECVQNKEVFTLLDKEIKDSE